MLATQQLLKRLTHTHVRSPISVFVSERHHRHADLVFVLLVFFVFSFFLFISGMPVWIVF